MMHQTVARTAAEWTELAPLLVDPELVEQVAAAGDAISDSLRREGRILFAGNGGSAAVASHLAAELVGRCVRDRAALSGLALADSASTITALGNDHGYESIFERGVSAFGREGDVLVAMTTSGTSPNVLRAMSRAAEMGIVTIAMTGTRGQAFAASGDHGLIVPSPSTQRVQEVHLAWGHAWCEAIDEQWHASELQALGSA